MAAITAVRAGLALSSRSTIAAPAKGKSSVHVSLRCTPAFRGGLASFTKQGNAQSGRVIGERNTGALTVCMAAPKRVAMVAKQIEREVGTMLLSDEVLQSAVCPERKRGMDSYLSALASVTEVELSRDLQVAKVYISVYSDDEGKEKAFENLKKLEGYVRKVLGKKIRLRMTPEIRLIPDESFERSQRVLSILKDIKAGTADLPPISIPSDEEEDELEFIYGDIMDLEEEEEDAEEEEEEEDAEARARKKAQSDANVAKFLGGNMVGAVDDISMLESNKPSRASKGGKRRGGGMRKKMGR